MGVAVFVLVAGLAFDVLFGHTFLKLKEGMLVVYRRRCVGDYSIGSSVHISIKVRKGGVALMNEIDTFGYGILLRDW
jgi:hypothetical protein